MRLSERCRIILRCADGLPSKVVAAKLGIHEHAVGKWRRRFLKDRIEGLLDEVRPGRPCTIDDDQVAAVIERTLRSTPVDATHWSIRSMAGVTGFSHTTIRRSLWAAAPSLGDLQAVHRSAVCRHASPRVIAQPHGFLGSIRTRPFTFVPARSEKGGQFIGRRSAL